MEAQMVVRQSIGTLGKTYQGNTITVQQSVGQVYTTKTFYDDGVESRPGFIQPHTLMVELIRSTMPKPIELMVFPNPTSEGVIFHAEDDLQNLVLQVQNTAGVGIQSAQIDVLEGYVLDCSQWPSGTYFITLKDKSDQVYYSKLIKK